LGVKIERANHDQREMKKKKPTHKNGGAENQKWGERLTR